MSFFAWILRNRKFWVVFAAAVLLVAAGGVYALYRAHRALDAARGEYRLANQVLFTRGELAGTLPAGFETLLSAPSDSDVALFQGRLHLAGAGGLVELDEAGKTAREFRPGLELPSSALVALATGLAGDSTEPELWIGTASEGLLAYNGRTLRHIRPEDASVRKVTALAAIGSGRIVFGTLRRGVLVYDGHRITWLHPSLRDVRVTALAGEESSLWIGTADQGLLHLHAGELSRFGEAEGLPDARVVSLAVAGDRAYAGTPAGVAEFTDGRLSRKLAPGLFARSLSVKDDRLLVGTLEEGVVEVPLGAGRHGAVSQMLEGEIRRIANIGGQLFAVAPGAVYLMGARGNWQRLGEPDPARLTDRNVSALSMDAEGRLWVGYFDRGLDVASPTGSTTHTEDDRVFCVNRIVEDPLRRATAVATANGLVFFDAALRQREVLGRAEGLIANHVTDLAVVPGGLAVATPAGITFLDAGGARSLYAFHGLVNNHVYALGAAGTRLLAGTLGGLSVLDGGDVRASYTTANSGLPHNWITAIVRAGEEWFLGTYGAGVVRLDSTGHWTPLPERSGGFVVNPNAMAVTEQAVYAGTLDRGLAIYDRAEGRWSLVTRGLPSNCVTAVARLGGLLYIGTDNGLVRVAEGNLSR